MPRLPVPPFTRARAIEKIRLAEDGWNSRDPARVALAYSQDSIWRNRVEFVTGRPGIVALLTRKWTRELDYRLIEELWAHGGNRITERFAYEFHDQRRRGHRAYGNETWELSDDGLMRHRQAIIIVRPIAKHERVFFWPLGRRPDDYPGLSSFGF